MNQPTYAESLAKDRDLYLRQRNKLAFLLRDLIDRIGDHGQEMAVKAARDFPADVFPDDGEDAS